MASEWRAVQLGEIAKFKAGSAFKPEHQGQLSGEVPFIKVSDLNLPGNEHSIRTANNWVSRDLARQIKAAIHPEGATVFAKIGVALTYNRRRLLLQDTAIDNNMMSAAPDGSVIRPRYLYFLLKSLDFNEVAHGSALPYLNVSDLKSITVELPDLQTQDAILELMAAIEDRVDCLLDANSTLEAIAQALFNSWFVDFDPVRAKAEGREPEGMHTATAALFPSEFENSELGLIPKGWRVEGLGRCCDNVRKQAKPEALDASTPYIGLEHMPRKSIALSDWDSAQGLASGKFWYQRGDVLFGKLRPYFHKVGVASHIGVCSTDILVIRATSPVWFGFAAMHLSSDALVSYATQLSNGAKMPRTNWHDLAAYKVAMPDDACALAFSEVAAPLVERIHSGIDSMRSLAELRDTLLPRLISGKLRLPEAERAAEAALA